jgi:predicted DCC family thiol-disulfide oxidoreductase YuxK
LTPFGNAHTTTPAYRVLYDGQCEICQASVAWLKTLGRQNKTLPVPISAEALSAVDSRLRLDECLRQWRSIPAHPRCESPLCGTFAG